MPNVSACFVEIARIVTNEVAQLLNAPVLVTDAEGSVLTSSELSHAYPLLWSGSNALASSLRIPLWHQAEYGEIVIGESNSQETISPRLAQVLVELVINRTAHSQACVVNQQERKNQFLYDLLHGRVQDEAIALDQASRLGMDLAPPRAVILVNAQRYVLGHSTSGTVASEAEQHSRIKLVIRSIVNFFHLPSDTICADLGGGEICILKASDTKNLDMWVEGEDVATGSSWANLIALRRAADALLLCLHCETGECVDIGIGRYHPGLSGLARSYEDANAALSLGTRFQGHNRVHCLGELGIAAFVGVADENTKVDLAKYLLSPLDHEPELLSTLSCFFNENCCPSSTAKQLSIHRNTLSYRLDKIFSLTGLEPRKFDHAVQMRLCLLLRSLQTPLSRSA